MEPTQTSDRVIPELLPNLTSEEPIIASIC